MAFQKVKDWILRQKFVQDYVQSCIKLEEPNYAVRLFKNARDDVKEEYQENIEDRAQELMEQRLRDMLSIVDYRKVVTLDKTKGILYIGGERVDEGRLANLYAEAQFLMESDIWGLLNETPKELAHQALFKVSESLDDLKKGKSILYVLNAQQNIVDILKSYQRK